MHLQLPLTPARETQGPKLGGDLQKTKRAIFLLSSIRPLELLLPSPPRISLLAFLDITYQVSHSRAYHQIQDLFPIVGKPDIGLLPRGPTLLLTLFLHVQEGTLLDQASWSP